MFRRKALEHNPLRLMLDLHMKGGGRRQPRRGKGVIRSSGFGLSKIKNVAPQCFFTIQFNKIMPQMFGSCLCNEKDAPDKC